MKLPKKTLMALFAATQLTACQWMHHVGISDQEKAYGNVQSHAPLAIPTNLSDSKIGSDTKTPDQVSHGQVFKNIPLPPGSLAEQVATGEVSKTVLSKPLPKPQKP